MSNSEDSSLSNLIATIESVAAGGALDDEDDQVLTTDMLESTVFHLSDGQEINVVQMTGSLDDTINVVQVETTELGDMTVGDICAIDIDVEEQKHILSETGAHVVVNTENESIPSPSPKSKSDESLQPDTPVVLPTVPFSFPGQTFDTKCQKLILNVWDFFRRVKKNPDLLDEIRTPQERAAAALHISAATIGKIGKNFKKTGKLEAPGKRRKRAKPVVDSVDAEQERVIRSVIRGFKENQVTPTLPLLLNECRERINFQGGATSFRRILQRMGYKGLGSSKYSSIPYPKVKSSSASNNRSNQPELLEESVKAVQKESFVSIPLNSTMSTSPTKKTTSKTASNNESSASVSIPLTLKQEPLSISNVSSKLISSILGGSFVQLGLDTKGETFTISPQIASALSLTKGSEPHTVHLLRSDNTLQPVQIVYTNITD